MLLALLIVCASAGRGFGAPEGAAVAEARPKRVYARFYGGFQAGRPPTSSVMSDFMHRRMRLEESEVKDGNPLRLGAVPLIPTRYLPRHAQLRPDASLHLDVRRAMRAGIDGFAISAWPGGSEARRSLHVLFRVVERYGYPFEITLSVDPFDINDNQNNPSLPRDRNVFRGMDESIEEMLHAVHYLVRRFGDHPNLARRDGKPLIFIGNGSLLVQGLIALDDDFRPRTIPEPQPDPRQSAEAFQQLRMDRGMEILRHEWKVLEDLVGMLEARVGRELYVVLDAGGWDRIRNEAGQPQRWSMESLPPDWRVEKAAALARFAPAVTLHRPGDDIDLDRAARAVAAAGAEWCYPLTWQYEDLDYRVRLHQFGAGAEGLRAAWESVIRQDAPLVLIDSWNDYRAISHLAPDLNHHYVPMLLTATYSERWKTGREPVPETDVLMAMYRRYPPGAPIFPRTRRYAEPETGALDIIALLRAPGRVRVPGRGPDGTALEWDAPAGLSVRSLPLDPGPVKAVVERGGETVAALECMEWITDRPFRQENAAVGESSAFQREWEADFSVPPFAGREHERPFYSEYGDLDGDGLPNWFEALFSGGRWMHPRDSVAMDPAGRAFGNMTVLEAYRRQRDPRLDQAPPPGISDDLFGGGGRVDDFDIDALLGE